MCTINEKPVKDKPPAPPVHLTSGRKKIFVKHIWGEFQKRRWLTFTFFASLFYLIPWLKIDGKNIVLFDIPARKFHIFSITLWPQEVYLLTLFLITSAVALFFSTAIVGRVWCGYMCPQTVFTSVFIEIERLIMGDSTKQKRYAKQGWNKEKIIRLSIRNLFWGLIALVTGFTFLSYFVPNTEIINQIMTGQLSGWSFFWFLFISGFAFFDFGFFREQFCFIPCPYGRFQGALQDPNSLVVTYDKVQGEQGKNGQKPACIDCNFCVAVCPTGIDIRHGAQFECISCARCIDACAVVQIKQKRSPDLIRYASENELNGKPTKIIRPRVILYSFIIFSLLGYIGYQLINRSGFGFQVIKDRTMVYQQLADGRVSNVYTLKLMNMSNEDQMYMLQLNDLNAELIATEVPLQVKSGEVHDTSISLIADPYKMKDKVNKFSFTIKRVDPTGINKEATQSSTFVIP
ncbi:MAG: cytochrome c oxidase accessory protein CcoG [Candidatus Sericytochromatia bacterium]